MFAVVGAETGEHETESVAFDLPEAIETVAGTVKAEESLAKEIETDPTGTAALKVTLMTTVPPPAVDFGVTVIDDSFGVGNRVTETFLVVPKKDAEIIAGVFAPTDELDIGKTADVAPPEIVTP